MDNETKKPIRVLVVDDEPALLDIYTTKLKMENYDVLTAGDGLSGLELALHESPDIMLLDVLMPGKDGFDVLRDLRSAPQTKDLPVIILSNLGQEYEVRRGLSLGANRFLTKADLTPARVAQAVKETLESPKAKG